jgi:hypothetical protein
MPAPDGKVVDVITSGSVRAFIPFTVLPDSWEGRQVVITLVPEKDLLSNKED